MCGLLPQVKAKPRHILMEEEERERGKTGEEDTTGEGGRVRVRKGEGRVEGGGQLCFALRTFMKH